MWTDWLACVQWAANEWAPGELMRRDGWDALAEDYEMWVAETFFLRRNRIDYWVRMTEFVNANLPRVQEWALDWMIAHGYGENNK